MAKVTRRIEAQRWGRWVNQSHLCFHPFARVNRITRAFSNMVLSVQISEEETEWGTVLHLWVRRNDQGTGVTWADLQRVKDEIVGPERTGVQVFPAQADLVDAANIYHVWVLPEGFRLPFGLDRIAAE